jgi:pimeloyl-ACP methyl ester carboxylesterase
VRGIVLLDSPIVYGWKAGLVSMAKAAGQMRRLSPAGVAIRRRDRWPNLVEAHRHFAAKPMFARWHPAVLNDYIHFGTEQDPADHAGTGRRLKFRPEIEAEIYSTVPHRLVAYLRLHPPGGPVAFVAGTRSREVRQVGLAATHRLTQGRISWMEGSHLFPFERPEDTVREVLDWIARLESES